MLEFTIHFSLVRVVGAIFMSFAGQFYILPDIRTPSRIRSLVWCALGNRKSECNMQIWLKYVLSIGTVIFR